MTIEIKQPNKPCPLADELERLMEARALGAIVTMSEGNNVGPAARRVATAEANLGRFIGENWPTILSALRAQPDRPADVVEAMQRLHNNLSSAPADAVKCFVSLDDHRAILAALSNPADRDRAEKMREALEPFAKAGDAAGTAWADNLALSVQRWAVASLTIGDLRRARAALQGESK